MALFGIGKDKNKKEKAAAKPAAEAVKRVKAPAQPVSGGVKDVILRPRVTEKAAGLTSANVYAFDIRMDATKTEVANAVKALYKVTPVKVNVVNTPAKRVRLRRRRGYGRVAASRKAYVFLKKGDTIALS